MASVCTPWLGTIHRPWPKRKAVALLPISPRSRLQCVSATDSSVARNACRVRLKANPLRELLPDIPVLLRLVFLAVVSYQSQYQQNYEHGYHAWRHRCISGRKYRINWIAAGPRLTKNMEGKTNRTSTGTILIVVLAAASSARCRCRNGQSGSAPPPAPSSRPHRCALPGCAKRRRGPCPPAIPG